jgi:hypothetical protein
VHVRLWKSALWGTPRSTGAVEARSRRWVRARSDAQCGLARSHRISHLTRRADVVRSQPPQPPQPSQPSQAAQAARGGITSFQLEPCKWCRALNAAGPPSSRFSASFRIGSSSSEPMPFGTGQPCCPSPSKATIGSASPHVAVITIKGPGTVIRSGFEYQIPTDDADALLRLCEAGVIDKVRFRFGRSRDPRAPVTFVPCRRRTGHLNWSTYSCPTACSPSASRRCSAPPP